MPNHSNNIESKSGFIMFIIFGMLALIFPIFKGDVILVDPFHYGEFFAATVSLFPDVKYSLHSLTIHGALDFIPALLSERQWGSENYFLPTFAIYKVLDFIAATFLILIAYKLTNNKSHQWLLLLAVAAVAPLLVGYRDLILLTSIYLFFQISECDVKRSGSFFLQIFFGAIVAFGMFWSYDRGIAGVLSLGAAVFVLLLKNRWYAISLLSFVVTVAGLSQFFRVFSIENYFNDIFILMQTSGQWSYGWSRWPVVLTAFVIIFNIIVISLLVVGSLNSKSLTEKLPLVVVFGFLSIFMLKMGINRADLSHIYFGFWIPMLVLLYIHEKTAYTKVGVGILISTFFIVAIALTIYFRSYGLAIVAGLLVFTVLRSKSESINKFTRILFGFLIAGCFVLISYNGVKNFSSGKYAWIKSLSSPASNRLSATDGVVWASDRLKESAVDCVFDLSNNGVVNGLVRRPSCSRFTYPVYAGPNHESILISDLNDASPRAIVYSSTYWSYNIDGKNMKNRFPKLDEFILKNYPKEECSYGYCVRYMEI
jgi:hypothetical protein